MGDQRPAFDGSSIQGETLTSKNGDDGSSIQWQTLTSKNGVAFEVGRKQKTDDVAEEKSKVNLIKSNGKTDFGIDVDWPVGNLWEDTSKDVQRTAAIKEYKLSDRGGLVYKYELQFTNTEHYDYFFEDETGDRYECDTWISSRHYVRYNSDKPKILNITGS